MTTNFVPQRNEYLRHQVLSATPAQLLVMLYDRLVLDLKRAEAAQTGQNWAVASEQLLHAQAIITELSSTLKTDAWDGADGLFATYTYVSSALMNANIHRDVELTREAIRLTIPLQEAWQEAAASLPGHASVSATLSSGNPISGSLGVG
ncbi:flagellar protein FliS [Arthrobacter crystallopoietes BAB-32]|uniref:Flagellar protein FliS n=1 Tax=Arthrobacter crystallopoietes BAB-32 TaxID=1246476 RepID=N1V1Y0_9MICC|nr:flagellar export chaperone FliS [Arthrobacter crystallopoietes]EMY34092.1 flagellar protein FliS [Arthrobacter crystallopoietes BAB-32]